MPAQQIIVCGASAGGLAALRELVGGLHPDIPAAVLVVVHTAPFAKSLLPEILARAGKLPAQHARDGEPIESAHIYVAPPNRHLLVSDSHMHLWYGPRENLSRPAIDPTMRSAALAYGSCAMGVILSGYLDDGSAGLLDIKRYGGIAIVQDPEEAAHADMPLSAIEHVKVDRVARVAQISELLNQLASSELPTGQRREGAAGMQNMPTTLTCPECRGALQEISTTDLLEFRCRVDHKYSAESVIAAHTETQERTLWSAIVAIDEGADLMDKVASRSTPEKAAELRRRAERNRNAAARLRKMLDELGSQAA